MHENGSGSDAAGRAAFTMAQSVYRSDHDHFPLQASWETTSEQVRDGWRRIANAAVHAVDLNEYAIAKAIAPYMAEGWTATDAARAVIDCLRSGGCEDAKGKDREEISASKPFFSPLAERTGRALEALIKPDASLQRVPNATRDSLRELISDLHLSIEDWMILYERQAQIAANERRLAFEQCALEARRYASFYGAGTDERNTFMMMAEYFDRKSQQ